MKIFITGNSGAGKSTLADKIGEYYTLKVCHLDNIVWQDSQKTSYESRRERLDIFLQNEDWVIEGMSHSEWVYKAYEKADYIFLLDTSEIVSNARIIKRYIKKKLHIDKNFREDIKYLKNLFKIKKDFKKNEIPKMLEMMENYSDKFYIIKSEKQLVKVIESTKI